MRLCLVALNGQPLPTLFMRYSESSFRTPITASTRVTLVIDVVTVFPYPTPFGFVMPIVFDDDGDPFWSFLILTLFPVDRFHGVELFWPLGHDPFASRRLLEACCNRTKCGVVLLNERHEVLKAEVVSLDQWDTHRPEEIVEVLRFLDSREACLDFAQCQATARLFEGFACLKVKRPDGKLILLPRKRWPHISSSHIYSLRVVNGRLIDRRLPDTPPHGDPRFDIFISHAHADSSFAWALRDWLVAAWPSLRVFVTNPAERSEFESNPAFFLENAQASRLMLFLVSATSLKREIVITEVGLQAGKPILPLLIGGVTHTDFATYAANQLFVCIDASSALNLTDPAAWDALARTIAQVCRLGAPERLTDPPAIPPRAIQDEHRDANYLAYWESVIQKVQRRQTEQEASVALGRMLRSMSGTKIPARAAELMKSFDVHSKLIVFLMHWEDEMFWRYVLGQLPALLTPRLDEVMLLHVDHFTGPAEEHERLKRLARLLHEAVAMEREYE